MRYSGKSISNSRLIAGLFREALFVSAQFRHSKYGNGELIDIYEADRRNSEISRHFLLRFGEEIDADQENSIASISILFANFIAQFECNVLRADNMDLLLEFPKSLSVSDYRSEHRQSAGSFASEYHSCLISDLDSHFEGAIRLINISKFGFAAEIRFQSSLDIRNGALLVAEISEQVGTIKLRGKVKQIDSRRLVGKHRTAIVRGSRIEQAPDVSTSQAERRREIRFLSNLHLNFFSVLNPDHEIPLILSDVSIGGFKAVCQTVLSKNMLLPMTTLRLQESSLVAEIVSVSELEVRCQWIDGHEKDRILWLKRVAKYLSTNVEPSTPDAQDLLSIFCEAGAFSAEFIKSEKMNLPKMMKKIESENSSDFYIHRWIEVTADGKVRGHLSALKAGDNIWMPGDLVGTNDKSRAISKQFVKMFFDSFQNFCLYSSPCPRILLTWVVDHPYWREFERELESDSSVVEAKFLLGYKRLVTDMVSGFSDILAHTRIIAKDFHLIKHISEGLQSLGRLAIAKAFDFSPETFGSPRLLALISARGAEFKRYYFEIVLPDNQRVLAIISKFPSGANPNRTADSVWCIPYMSLDINRLYLDSLSKTVQFIALGLGIKIPGLRLVVNEKSKDFLDDLLSARLVEPIALSKLTESA